jgi:hypothetical protein
MPRGLDSRGRLPAETGRPLSLFASLAVLTARNLQWFPATGSGLCLRALAQQLKNSDTQTEVLLRAKFPVAVLNRLVIRVGSRLSFVSVIPVKAVRACSKTIE